MGMEALMRIALAQINPTVGDLAGNLRKHLDALARARDAGAQVVVFPEMSILGYPPKDLLLKPAVIPLAAQAVQGGAEAAAKGGGGGGGRHHRPRGLSRKKHRLRRPPAA